MPKAKPDAKKTTRARYFLGRRAGTGKPAASASRARYKSPPEAFLPPSQPPSPVPPDIDFGASEAHHGHYLFRQDSGSFDEILVVLLIFRQDSGSFDEILVVLLTFRQDSGSFDEILVVLLRFR